MLKRIVVHLLGLLQIAIGIRLMIIASLGLFPLDALVSYLSDVLNVQFWLGSFVINVIIMSICVIIKRNWKLSASIINSIIFSGMLGLIAYLSANIQINTIWGEWLIAALGFFLIAIGINFTIYSKLVAAPVELAMLLFDDIFKNLTLSKLVIEIIFLLAALGFAISLASYGNIGWFTVIAIVTISPMIHILNRPITLLLGGNNSKKEKNYGIK